MSAARGVLAGTLGLSLLQAILSSQKGASNVGGAFTTVAGIFNRLVDYSVPLIPDKRKASSASASGPTVRIEANNYTTQTPGGATAATVPTTLNA